MRLTASEHGISQIDVRETLGGETGV